MMISDYSNRGTQIHFPAPFNSISGTFSSERYMDILDEQHEASKIEFLYPLADPRSLEKALKSIYDNKKFNFWEIITFKKNRYINDYNRLSASFRLEGFKTYHKSIKECVSKMIEYEKAIKNVKEELITYKYKILRVKFLVQMIHLENSIFEEEENNH